MRSRCDGHPADLERRNHGTTKDGRPLEVGEYQFTQYDDNGQALFGFAIGDEPAGYELYGSLDHALAAAVAEKHTGRRGAGGEAVGTAADWFMRMIGAPIE